MASDHELAIIGLPTDAEQVPQGDLELGQLGMEGSRMGLAVDCPACQLSYLFRLGHSGRGHCYTAAANHDAPPFFNNTILYWVRSTVVPLSCAALPL